MRDVLKLVSAGFVGAVVASGVGSMFRGNIREEVATKRIVLLDDKGEEVGTWKVEGGRQTLNMFANGHVTTSIEPNSIWLHTPELKQYVRLTASRFAADLLLHNDQYQDVRIAAE